MMRFRFGPFILDPIAGQLRCEGEEVSLQPLAFQLLQHLVERPGELASREELMQLLWPGVAVTDNSLEQVVRRVRKALAPEDVVQTVPRRGYRLVAEVQPVEDAPVPQGNLQPLPGRFVGRGAAIDDLRRRVERGERLITLTGPGGAGKTALAHQLALSLDLPGWFVDLAPCTTELDVVSAAARALRVDLDDSDPAGHVGWALSRLGPALVLLDNFEQVTGAAPATVGRWLREAPDVVFVATSRIVLGLRGERPVPVAPLSATEGLALLAERGNLTGDEPGCAELVQALDGLPLAIELAARRTRVLSPRELLERIEDRFALLTDPSGDRPARHRSLDAALATSWDLLDDAEQRALGQLTVFEGPLELPAAEAVIDAGRSVLDILQGLVDQSLVRSLPRRFVLLDTIRAWAASRAAPDDLRRAEERHARWFARGELRPEELDDVVAATRRALARSDSEAAASCALTAAGLLKRTGPVQLAADLLEQALAADDGTRRLRLLSERISTLQSDRPDAARACAEEAIALARRAGDTHREAVLRIDLSNVLRLEGDLDGAEEQLLAALERLEDDPYHRGLVLTLLGAVEGRRTRSERAIELHEQAIATFRAAGEEVGEATAVGNLAIELDYAGRASEAEQRYREALALRRRRGDRSGEASLLGNLAVLLHHAGRSDEALEVQREALRLVRMVGLRRLEGLQLGNLGMLHLERGELDAAAEVLAEGLELARRIDNPLREAHLMMVQARYHRERGDLDSAEELVGQALERLERNGDTRMLVSALLEQATLRVAHADPEAARRALDRVTALSDGGRSLDRPTRAHLEKLQRALQS